MKKIAAAVGLTYIALLVAALCLIASTSTVTKSAKPAPPPQAGAEIVYVSNYAQQFISDTTIRNDIPAWEYAINHDFARYWHTAHYKIVFLGAKPAPSGAISAVFQTKGPIKGALAYHWTERGNSPSITVYAGTDDYYGFDNSVSFTHELEELAADPVTSFVNQGYPSSFYWLEKKNLSIQVGVQFGVIGWFNEVSDPVEADSYTLPGANGKAVKISDFVTPAWFNDGVGGRYDFLGLCQQPFWIRPGGYAQYLDGSGWNLVENFRTNHPSDRGFVKSDPKGRK